MSTHESTPQKLKFRILFVNVDAEGRHALKVANRQLLILSSALSLVLLILALNQSLPGWSSLFSRMTSWLTFL